MPLYPYICPSCGVEEEIKRPFSARFFAYCARCSVPMVRVYTPPVISVPEMNAVDVLNRHARGEGDPVPGWSQAKTQKAALAQAAQPKVFSGKVPDKVSYPGSPAHNKNAPE